MKEVESLSFNIDVGGGEQNPEDSKGKRGKQTRQLHTQILSSASASKDATPQKVIRTTLLPKGKAGQQPKKATTKQTTAAKTGGQEQNQAQPGHQVWIASLYHSEYSSDHEPSRPAD